MTHWIIAPIVLPALAAALMLLALRGSLALQRLLSVAAILGLCAIAAALLMLVTKTGPEAYFLGDWPAPWDRSGAGPAVRADAGAAGGACASQS